MLLAAVVILIITALMIEGHALWGIGFSTLLLYNYHRSVVANYWVLLMFLLVWMRAYPPKDTIYSVAFDVCMVQAYLVLLILVCQMTVGTDALPALINSVGVFWLIPLCTLAMSYQQDCLTVWLVCFFLYAIGYYFCT